DTWLLSAPIDMLAGWLSAASCVATGVFLSGMGVLEPVTAALIMLAVVLVIALSVQHFKPGQPLYGLTVIWALVGILVANWADAKLVAYAATAGIILMALGLIRNMTRRV